MIGDVHNPPEIFTINDEQFMFVSEHPYETRIVVLYPGDAYLTEHGARLPVMRPWDGDDGGAIEIGPAS